MKLPIIILATLATCMARDIPSNLQRFYDTVKNAGPCTGDDLLQDGLFDQDDSTDEWSYCDRNFTGRGLYIKGPGTDLANTDIDCDGDQQNADPRCLGSSDTQPATAFRRQVQRLSNITDLNASIHPYVVLGNVGDVTFDPRDHGIEPLSVVAVVCGGQLIYGIWGDINGNDGMALVGEGSLALATACFGDSMNGNNGHDEPDVLYLAFSGRNAVPRNANWAARSYDEFEASIMALGDALVARV